MPFNVTRPTSLQAVIISVILIGLILAPTNNTEPLVLTITPLQQILNDIFNYSLWIPYVAGFLMLSVITVLLGRVAMRSSALSFKGYAPMVIFLTLTLASVDVTETPRTLLSVLFAMLALNHMMNSRKNDDLAAGEWAVIGWWTSLAVITSSEAVIMFLMIPLGIFLYRTWYAKEFLAALGGFLLPIALINLTYIIIGISPLLVINAIQNLWIYPSFLDIMINDANVIQQGFGALVLIYIAISVIVFLARSGSQLATMRGHLFYLILCLILITWTLLAPVFTPTILVLLYIPLSVVLTKGLESKKNNLWLTILYILLIAGAISCKYHIQILAFVEKNV